MFKTCFDRVTTNKQVKSDIGESDVDVIVFEQEKLYLFECKHSLPPTGPHEIRDCWEDIEKGAEQLKIAKRALEDNFRRNDYLAGWFPGTKKRDTANLEIHLCVLCSHRIFSGLTRGGIPVWDYSSLSRLVESGVVSAGIRENEQQIVMTRHRMLIGEEFTAADLENYLSENSRFFGSYKAFMHQVSRFSRIRNVTFATETYGYDVDFEHYSEELEKIGCVRLEDEIVALQEPLTPDELQTMLENRSLDSSDDQHRHTNGEA